MLPYLGFARSLPILNRGNCKKRLVNQLFVYKTTSTQDVPMKQENQNIPSMSPDIIKEVESLEKTARATSLTDLDSFRVEMKPFMKACGSCLGDLKVKKFEKSQKSNFHDWKVKKLKFVSFKSHEIFVGFGKTVMYRH